MLEISGQVPEIFSNLETFLTYARNFRTHARRFMQSGNLCVIWYKKPRADTNCCLFIHETVMRQYTTLLQLSVQLEVGKWVIFQQGGHMTMAQLTAMQW